MSTKRLGGLAETVATLFFEMKGCEVLARNYVFLGNEIDLVARCAERVVFVEVKCRSGARRGSPREAVGAEKMRRLVRAAKGFLSERGLTGLATRFDVVEVRVERGGLELVAEHFPGAFGADLRGW